MMKLRSLLPALVLLFASCNAQGPKEINADEFQAGISKPGILLVDVRTPEEYVEKHIANSKEIDYNNSAVFENEFSKLDRSKPLYLYCLSGARSDKAGAYALKNGFTEVYNLKGGINAWLGKHKPVETANNIPAAGGMTFDDYLKRIKASNKLVLVDFSAVWCGPCRMLKPAVDKVVNENKDKVELFAVDVDKNSSVAGQLHIESIPLLILYKNGKEVWRNLGLTDEGTIADAIRKHSK